MSRNVRIRSNRADTWIVQAVPELQIVDSDLWNKVQRQLELRAQTHPSTQRRGRHLLSGIGRCGVCDSGWVRIRSGYWGCAGHRDGSGCANNRVISDGCYESRVLCGLTEKLLDPGAVDLFVREYHSEMARRDREEANERPAIERKIGKVDGRIERLIDALADGIGDIDRVKQRLRDAHAEKLALEECLANLDAKGVVALHPNVALEYRREVEALNRALKGNDAPEICDEVIPRIRALVDSIILTPRTGGRGVDIEVTGRLARIIELATGREPEAAVMIKPERAKGIEPSS